MKNPWLRIASAAAHVVLLSQRRSGFWSLPTNEAELSLLYTDPNSAEGTIREEEKFGFESITVSWNALTSLDTILARLPEQSRRRVLARLDVCREKVEPGRKGAYGIYAGSGYGDGGVRTSVRHTAMGLLLLNALSDRLSAPQKTPLLRESIAWLVRNGDTSERKLPYEVEPPSNDRSVTIAAYIAALSCALNTFTSSPHENDRLITDTISAIRKAHDDLYAALTSGFWNTRYKTVEVVDNCFIIDLIKKAISEGQLAKIAPDAPGQIERITERLQRVALTDGWPETFGKHTVSLSATISGLLAIDGLHDLGGFQRRAKQFVVERLSSKNGAETLTSWNWMALARLAAKEGRQLSESESLSITRAAERIGETSRQGLLARVSVNCVPKIGRRAILFALSEGNPCDVPMIRPGTWFRGWPGWVRWIAGIFGTAMIIVLGDKVLEFSKHLIFRLFAAMSNPTN